jgi:hypothetical protein
LQLTSLVRGKFGVRIVNAASDRTDCGKQARADENSHGYLLIAFHVEFPYHQQGQTRAHQVGDDRPYYVGPLDREVLMSHKICLPPWTLDPNERTLELQQ